MALGKKSDTVKYPIAGPFMNRSVPENKVPPGSFGELVGVDPRYDGCLRKFFGMKEVHDLADATRPIIDDEAGPSFIKHVAFHKKGTSIITRGFVIRWDESDSLAHQSVDLYYTEDGSTWAEHAIWAYGTNGISSTLDMDCTTQGDYLYVAIEGKATKVVYYDDTAGVTAYVTKDAGPGAYSATLGAMAESSTAQDDDYHLKGDGVYQAAYRFYDSTRGIYSALSDPVTVAMDHYETTKAVGSILLNYQGGGCRPTSTR